MTDETAQEQTNEPKQEQTQDQPKSVKPDEIIKPVINEELLKELNKSISELKEVENNLFEQQKNFAIKGVSDNEDEQLTYWYSKH